MNMLNMNTNLSMLNSMVIFTFSVLGWNTLFEQICFKKTNFFDLNMLNSVVRIPFSILAQKEVTFLGKVGLKIKNCLF